MNKNTTIIMVAAAAIIVILAASFIVMNKGGDEPKDPSIVDQWELVSAYTGSWLDDEPLYEERLVQSQTATIKHYKGDFYTFDMGGRLLYCSWDGTKMVTAGVHGNSGAAFIMQLPENSNFMTLSYFMEEDAVIELYKRVGYAGNFPGLNMPADIPGEGTVVNSYKLKEYTEEGVRDVGVNTMAISNVSGRMIFYDVVGTDGYMADYIGIYLDSGMFMSLGMTEVGSAYEMTQYRDGVFYCSAMIEGTDEIWVTEYGDPLDASYPDTNIEGSSYYGAEDVVIFKDGKITEEKNSNGIGLTVLMQDDGCLKIVTLDQSGTELATWTAMFYELKHPHYYGMFIQSSIEYMDVYYQGMYFGHFDSKDCSELWIHGVLFGEDGSIIVISQKYTTDDTGQLQSA